MFGLCRYSAALGVPGEGVHKYSIGGLAAADLLGTAALAWLFAKYGLRDTGMLAFVLAFVLLILVASFVHSAFCVDTRLNAAMGILSRPSRTSPAPEYPRKTGRRSARGAEM